MHFVIKENNVLDRETVEKFVSIVPEKWVNRINVIMVDTFDGNQIVMSYFRKKRILGVHIPKTFNGTKSSALEDVAITIQAIAEYGVIPEKISLIRFRKYKQNCKKLKGLVL